MKLLFIAFFVTLSVTALFGQPHEPPPGSPDELLDRYLKMINDGDLLTRESWNRAAKLFVHPSPAWRNDTIFVTTKFPLGNGPMDVVGDHAEAGEKWVDDIGTVDSALRYQRPPKSRIQLEGVVRLFRLSFTARHWEIGPDGKSEVEVSGPPQWRIEGSLGIRSASREATIRYLERIRDLVTDPALVGNANRTIAILKRLPAPRTHI